MNCALALYKSPAPAPAWRRVAMAAALGLVTLVGPPAAQPADASQLALRAARVNLATVPRYGKFELALDLSGAYQNPFDPDEIDVYAIFTPPSGTGVRVNGFLWQPFTRRLEGGQERLEPAGPPAWKVRFAPAIMGRWRYGVFAKDRTGNVSLPEGHFEVAPSDAPGFIRRSQRNPSAFAYDDGRPFFAVGENMGWAGGRGTFEYDEWLGALGKAGGNWIRVWMSSWNCALEWSSESKGDWRSGNYAGVGNYSLGNAWKLDVILDSAERAGAAVMVCFGTYGEFNEGGYFNEGQWKGNPYNAANGGPCAKPEDFWTNEQARKLYQRRLRYLAARYACRTCVQSWEFWNEAKAPAAWVAEMARCMKGTGEFSGRPADPYGHLLTTTYGTPEVWRIPEIDFTQTHSYGKGDIPDHAPVVHRDARAHAVYGKPHLMGEFGIDWRAPDSKYDPGKKGINLHNALWASALSGNAGGAMTWWWDNYVHPANFYGQFTPLRRFVDTVPWTDGEWKPLEAEPSGVSLYGLSNGRTAILWAQNPEHHWKNAFENKPMPPVRGAKVVVRGLPPGRYVVEWWDTWKGEITKRDSAACANGVLSLEIPELETDMAARIGLGKAGE
jgi:hypothetical protein